MLIYPRVAPNYRAETVDGNTVFLLSEHGHVWLRGNLYGHLFPLLDGKHSLERIAENLRPWGPAEEVMFALTRLARKGFIQESGVEKDIDRLRLPSLPPATRFTDREPPVAQLTTLDPVHEKPMRSALNEAGFSLVEGETENALHLVVVEDYLDARLREINQRAPRRKRPWMLVKPFGLEPWVGPIFAPESGGCWACLAHRIEGNRPLEGVLMRLLDRDVPPRHPIRNRPEYQIFAAKLAYRLALNETLGVREPERVLLTLDAREGRVKRHAFIRRPQCAQCGEPRYQGICDAAVPSLRGRRKTHFSALGHRAKPAAEVLASLRHHVSPITGIVNELRTAPGKADAEWAHSVYAGPNRALRPEGIQNWIRYRENISGGKGFSEEQARTSAICEAIERHSWVWQGYEPRTFAAMSDLGERALHPNQCMHFSPSQYRQPDRMRVPEPFDPNHPLTWVPLWSFRQQCFRYLPAQYCYLNFPLGREPRFCFSDANGHAAGSCLEEAMLQALLELVERDSVCIWWYNGLRRPAVDPASFESGFIRDAAAQHHGIGRELWALDLCFDLEVPVFAVISRPIRKGTEATAIGFGAHLDAGIAMSRALAEVNQMLPGARNGPAKEGDGVIPAWMKPDTSTPIRKAADFESTWSEDFLEDLTNLVNLFGSKGMDTLMLDLTRPDTGLAVVKAVAPGLRHFWPRFAPGRLYNVPLQLGLLDRPRQESELNPRPFFV